MLCNIFTLIIQPYTYYTTYLPIHGNGETDTVFKMENGKYTLPGGEFIVPCIT
jgi:hypothetical protein